MIHVLWYRWHRQRKRRVHIDFDVFTPAGKRAVMLTAPWATAVC